MLIIHIGINTELEIIEVVEEVGQNKADVEKLHLANRKRLMDHVKENALYPEILNSVIGPVD
jgi:hypothetical protein